MDYTKQNFNSGEILTATALNAMDELIFTNSTKIEEIENAEYVLLSIYQEKINELESTIAVLESRIAALEPTTEQ